MNKSTKVKIFGTLIILVVVAVFLGMEIKDRLTPSDEVMLLTDYYQVDSTEVMIILQDEIYEKKGKLIEGEVYLDYETVVENFNHRFYWDQNEEKLIYTTPTEIITAEVDSNEYWIEAEEKKAHTTEQPIVRKVSEMVYLSLGFIEEHSDLRSEFYEGPNRLVIHYRWGDYLYTKVSKETQLRLEANIKSPILQDLAVGEELFYVDLDKAPKRGFSKVITKEGVIGFVKNNALEQSNYMELKSSFDQPKYTSQTTDEDINLVFHQVFNSSGAEELEDLLSHTKGVNVISPTWFSIVDNEGTFTSLASKEYMKKARDLDLQVWALIDDFSLDVDMLEVLSYTSKREGLIKALMDKVDKYDLDGINIDFERIQPDTGLHFIQFLRELSVKCRNEEIILSVDNFVPPFKKHYNRQEQGKILDYIILMAYDEHYAGSEAAGPNASIGFVEDAARNIIEEAPKEKVIMAIPFYTRLWKETADGSASRESDLAMTPAFEWIEENGIEKVWDDVYGSYYAEVKKDGATYKMWLEESKSIEEKMKVIVDGDFAGVAAWKLGLETPEVWDVIDEYINK